MKAALVFALAVLGSALASPLEYESDVEITPFAEGDIDYRLTYDIIPTRYDLEFTPYFANVTFLNFFNRTTSLKTLFTGDH